MNLIRLPALVALMAALTLTSQAATLSTAGMADAGYDLVTWNNWKGQSFHLAPTTSPSLITSITLRLEVLVPNSTFTVRVVGNDGAPGRPNMADVRAELTSPAMAAAGVGVAVITFFPDPGRPQAALEPDATYWLVAGMLSEDHDQPLPAGLVRWRYSAAHGQDPAAEPGWTVGSAVASSGTAGSAWLPVTETPFLFSATAMPIPEPGSATLLLGLAALMWRRRR